MGLFDIFKKKEEKQEEEKKQEAVTPAATAVKRNPVAPPTSKLPSKEERLQAKKDLEDALAAKVEEAVHVKTAEEKEAELVKLAKEVIRGDWGNGGERKKRLEEAGYVYAEVQGKVNELLGITPAEKKEVPAEEGKKTVDELAREVIKGLWGNGGERKKRLEEAGYSYVEVQNRVNQILSKK